MPEQIVCLTAFHTLSLLYFQLLHFPSVRSIPAFSTPAFSTPSFSAPPPFSAAEITYTHVSHQLLFLLERHSVYDHETTQLLQRLQRRSATVIFFSAEIFSVLICYRHVK